MAMPRSTSRSVRLWTEELRLVGFSSEAAAWSAGVALSCGLVMRENGTLLPLANGFGKLPGECPHTALESVFDCRGSRSSLFQASRSKCRLPCKHPLFSAARVKMLQKRLLKGRRISENRSIRRTKSLDHRKSTSGCHARKSGTDRKGIGWTSTGGVRDPWCRDRKSVV